MNNVILSDRYPIFAERLQELGYHVIPSERIEKLIPYEQDHADMQCLILADTAFVLKCCRRISDELSKKYHVVRCDDPISGAYPNQVRLNAAVVGKYVIARVKTLDHYVIEYCQNNGYQLIDVNQGYAKCSCAVISDHAVITADNGIYNSLKEYKIDVLKIKEGRVALKGTDYGFIGGASGLDVQNGQRTLYFSGNIDTHPDSNRIRSYCQKHGTKILSLTDGELIDIGGILFC